MTGHEPAAFRYAQALFDLLRPEGRLDEASRELAELAELIRHYEALRKFLVNPDVETADKLRVLDRLREPAWSKDVRAFVQVVVSFGRAPLLGEIAEAFGELVDAERRVVHVRVRTVHPLSATFKTQLAKRIEQLEHGSIQITEELDHALLGGIQVVIGNRVFDGSLKSQLNRLRQRLKSVRVH